MHVQPSTSNSVRRFARTLTEAFGPHTSNRVEPMPLTPAEKSARDNRELAAVAILAGLAALAGLFVIWSTAHP